jgi:hypothetical protein
MIKEEDFNIKDWNDQARRMGLFPLLKMIEVRTCLICGEDVNVKSLTKHLKNKHFDEYYKIVMGVCK